MSQLNIYVPNEVEEVIRKEAKNKGKTISNYLAEIIKGHFKKDRWDKNFFTQVVGKWQGAFPKIERQVPEEREGL